jgi:hypothetical protein
MKDTVASAFDLSHGADKSKITLVFRLAAVFLFRYKAFETHHDALTPIIRPEGSGEATDKIFSF